MLICPTAEQADPGVNEAAQQIGDMLQVMDTFYPVAEDGSVLLSPFAADLGDGNIIHGIAYTQDRAYMVVASRRRSIR